MRTPRVNPDQIARNIARLIYDRPEKIRQLETVQSITAHLTSDDYVYITCELYRDGIARYLIRGTRSSMTITARVLSREACRKPRNERPWMDAETSMWAGDILRKVEAMREA